ncbi:hypothetical protein PX699_26605, partial [Sphingobium sp. H39-3-25]|uniref:hypothetical protein n=1 Tax=Sphingobium arseniciresistens TaxID=3030834 RepID=UPI0023BA25C9|nr:hypothetical protein [Sphingobium arseniciresistens]
NSPQAKSDTYDLAFPACSASTVQLGFGTLPPHPPSVKTDIPPAKSPKTERRFIIPNQSSALIHLHT